MSFMMHNDRSIFLVHISIRSVIAHIGKLILDVPRNVRLTDWVLDSLIFDEACSLLLNLEHFLWNLILLSGFWQILISVYAFDILIASCLILSFWTSRQLLDCNCIVARTIEISVPDILIYSIAALRSFSMSTRWCSLATQQIVKLLVTFALFAIDHWRQAMWRSTWMVFLSLLYLLARINEPCLICSILSLDLGWYSTNWLRWRRVLLNNEHFLTSFCNRMHPWIWLTERWLVQYRSLDQRTGCSTAVHWHLFLLFLSLIQHVDHDILLTVFAALACLIYVSITLHHYLLGLLVWACCLMSRCRLCSHFNKPSIKHNIWWILNWAFIAWVVMIRTGSYAYKASLAIVVAATNPIRITLHTIALLLLQVQFLVDWSMRAFALWSTVDTNDTVAIFGRLFAVSCHFFTAKRFLRSICWGQLLSSGSFDYALLHIVCCLALMSDLAEDHLRVRMVVIICRLKTRYFSRLDTRISSFIYLISCRTLLLSAITPVCVLTWNCRLIVLWSSCTLFKTSSLLHRVMS